jgi:hypothetical protein
MCRPILSLFLLVLFLLPASAEAPLADGFYRVMRTYPDSASIAEKLDTGERMLKYNPTFLDPEDNAEEVVIVRFEPNVPLQLAEPPSKVADRTERTKFWLGVSLTADAAEKLRDVHRREPGPEGRHRGRGRSDHHARHQRGHPGR